MKKRYSIDSNPELLQVIETKLDEKSLQLDWKIDRVQKILDIDRLNDSLEEELDTIFEIIKTIDNNCIIKEIPLLEVYRKVLTLEGLDCANCAAKIERIARRKLDSDLIIVDFATSRFIIETSNYEIIDNIVSIVQDIANKVDINIKVYDKSVVKEITKASLKIEKAGKIRFIFGASVFVIALVLQYFIFRNNEGFDYNNISDLSKSKNVILICMYFVSLISIGGEVIVGAFRNATSGRIFDEKFLMTLATIMAFCIGSYIEAVSVMTFYKIGVMVQLFAVNKSRKSISSLLDIKPEFATLITHGSEVEVDPNEIAIGDLILVRPGERVPLDGVVIEGTSTLDTSAITGETKYYDVASGQKIISGSINISGVLKIKVTKKYDDSMVAKIINMVKDANINKANTEKFITKFAKFYTPIVCGLAIIIVIANFIFTEKSVYDSIYPAMIFLVVSCPCALVISVPLGFFGAIGGAGKRGILIKGSNHLESLYDTKLIVFDKTGTLTKGKFVVTEIVNLKEEKEEIIKYAAYCEFYSSHPIAKSIVEYFGKENIDPQLVEYIPNKSKKGTKVKVADDEICAGNLEFIKENKITVPHIKSNGLVVYVCKNNNCIGYIVLEDEIKEESKETIDQLKELGIKTAMISGDAENIVENVANRLGIDTYFANMSPIDKVKKVRRLKKSLNNKKLVFVGDGINDAPVLNTADVGVAMGSYGSDAAIEVADVVLMNDDLRKIPEAIAIANRTKTIIYQNIIFALAVKIIVMFLAVFAGGEYAHMWEAIFADVGVSLVAIANSLRAARPTAKDYQKIKLNLEKKD